MAKQKLRRPQGAGVGPKLCPGPKDRQKNECLAATIEQENRKCPVRIFAKPATRIAACSNAC
jgi:hypothetical protein